MPHASEHHVFLAVFNFGNDPAVVTRLLGLPPTKAYAQGDPLPNHPTAKYTHNRWTLQSALPLAAPIEDHLDNLLPLLEARRPALADLLTRFEARLAIAAYFRSVNPGFLLSAPTIQRIAALHLELDFDLYCLADP